MQTVYKKKSGIPASTGDNNDNIKYDMVVFCHLRWDFVYQRPQHIISRLAKSLKILLIEEPWHRPEQEGSRLVEVAANLHILQPNVYHIDEIAGILPQYTNKNTATGWFYSASFLPLLDYFDFDTVVYDCMDELSLFKGAPEKLVSQERSLMDRADIVFTGGKSLYESKVKHHENVYCFPSSVDRDHFSKALNGLAIPEDIVTIKSPIVGYFGVIDERINLDLLKETAILKPEVSFVMIGPLAKIGEHDLPRLHNIHYLGMKDYKELPGYLKAFSIAMMPFALNDATKYISPTKTLEYMAAGKPIISTAIYDVVRDYSEDVTIISNSGEFSKAIDAMLANNNVLNPTDYSDILEKTSWDVTVEKMQAIIKNTVK
ncbi:glycosyltransferase family 1 protein [Flavobacterium zepuense]|uniref:Glycosyltransferase family 1 protein n=1 Tax=Flavobacterium zepuense TaxID=2593302 RepID=A0A552V9P0_9FLAO|nr:glycosyltransferase [Flavobacterium zepuense]TRW27184.1 glycosyltransferase family 1 protein [Flavobacterium zepuense]